MVNNGIVIGGVLATIGIVFGIFVLLNSMPEAQDGELIVSNGNHLETVGEITSIEKTSNFYDTKQSSTPTSGYC